MKPNICIPSCGNLSSCNTYGQQSLVKVKHTERWASFLSPTYRVTQDIKRRRLPAMGVAAYNGWSLFVRLAHSRARREAITSRPLLRSGVGRKTTHAGQQHRAIAPVHGKARHTIALLTQVSLLLKEWKRIAQQSPLKSVWFQVCEPIATLITGFNRLAPPESRLRLGTQSS